MAPGSRAPVRSAWRDPAWLVLAAAGLALLLACSRDFAFLQVSGGPDAGDDATTQDAQPDRDASSPSDAARSDAEAAAPSDAEAAAASDAGPSDGSVGDSGPVSLRTLGAGTNYLGSSSTCAIVDGGVACWGDDEYGQLGRGGDAGRQTGANSELPVRVVLPDGGPLQGVRGVTMARATACALVDDRAYCWGDNEFGELGSNTGARYNPWPTPVGAPLTGLTEVACGSAFCLATTAGGTVWGWGLNNVAQLTDGGPVGATLQPVVIAPLAGARTVSAGIEHACAVMPTGTVRCWGANSFWKTGLVSAETCAFAGTDWACVRGPYEVPGLDQAVEVAAGEEHTCARRANGDVLCWGLASEGQLGIPPGDAGACTRPDAAAEACTETPRLALTGASRVVAGGPISCAVKGGEVFCWGGDGYAQRGQGSATSAAFPAPARVLVGPSTPLVGVVDVTASRTHCCAQTGAGEVYCWGTDGAHANGPGPALASYARRVIP